MNSPTELLDARTMLAGLKEVVKRALWTLAAIRDPDARFRYQGTAWGFDVVQTMQEAYGYSKPRVRSFAPSPEDVSQMEIVAVWLAWIRRTGGENDLRRIIGWAMAVPTWRLAQREACSEKTILNRIDRSLNSILKEFGNMDAGVERIEEKRVFAGCSFNLERPSIWDAVADPSKVYVAGVGWMKNGKKWRDGQERASRKEFT